MPRVVLRVRPSGPRQGGPFSWAGEAGTDVAGDQALADPSLAAPVAQISFLRRASWISIIPSLFASAPAAAPASSPRQGSGSAFSAGKWVSWPLRPPRALRNSLERRQSGKGPQAEVLQELRCRTIHHGLAGTSFFDLHEPALHEFLTCRPRSRRGSLRPPSS